MEEIIIMSMRFVTLTSLNSMSNSIQIDWKLCEVIDADVIDFWHICDLEWSRSNRLYQNVEFNNIYHHTNFKLNQFINVRMHASLNIFWCSQQNISYFPRIIKSHSKIVSEISAWISSTPYHISTWSIEMCARKWSQEVFLSADLVTPRTGQSQWKWYKMVEVNGACKHGRYEKKTDRKVCV